jgi:cell envelope-related function transcriptional attenuator common domain
MNENNRGNASSSHNLLKRIFRILLVSSVVIVLSLTVIGIKVFHDIRTTADDTYETVERRSAPTNTRQIHLSNQEPMSILLLGIDTGDLGRTEQGRSDTMIVATLNPTTSKSTLVSLPRDTYTNIVGQHTYDKMNHAYAFGGAAMSMDTVEQLLNTPINHYVTINMRGIKELVDAVGGIDVMNTSEFTYESTTFHEGKQGLTGEQSLKYIRMRYDDPKGDYGRQERQRQVIMAITKKMLSMNGLTSYRSILNVLGENVKTDLTFNDMKTLASGYRSALLNIKSDQMKGEGFMKDGISYQRIDASELSRVQEELNSELKNVKDN